MLYRFKIMLLLWYCIHQYSISKASQSIAFEINKQYINEVNNNNTYIDSNYLNFKTYFAYKNGNIISVVQDYNATDYRLDKYILLAVQYINATDTIVTQNLYSNIYTYKFVGEFELTDSQTLHLKPSNAIKSNQQFISIRLLPKQSILAFLLYKPISFKDYSEQKNIVYNYSNRFDFPKHQTGTYKRNYGFTIQFLFLLGMVLIMFIFYVLAFVYLKDKIYLYYTFYLLTTFIQVLYMSQYIFSKNLKMFNFIGNSAVDETTKGLMIFFYSIFYKQAFSITKKDRMLYFSIEALKYISLVYVAVITFSHLFSIAFYSEPFVYSFYRVPIFFFSIIILICTYTIKYRSFFQNIIYSGSLVYTIFTAISTMQKINFPFKNLYLDLNLLYIGVGLELIIFSVALMVRIKDTFLANEKLKDKLIFELQHNEEFIKNENIFLEEKVKERVYEIKQQNLLIEEQQKQALIQSFEKEKVEIQMQALSAQMNPHFIFNCMNSIQHSIVTNNTEKASVMLHDFASLIRMVLENSSQPDIRLEDEIKLLETYLKLEQIRTNNGFDYIVAVDEIISTDFIRIPTMMLQPFLENAIWHGFKFISYKGIIRVDFSMQGNSICCTVTDNGIGRNKAQINNNDNVKKSMAIQIIRNRIGLLNHSLTDNKASLEIVDLVDEHQQATGTRVIIRLPIL